ncbi:MAG: HAMP domain-containing protein [Erysipelotrichia bacterium]|nr:HAMP domain-containing protein [Erysipelotrichia bacterium]
MNLDQPLNPKAKNFSVGFRQKIAIVFTLLITFIMLISVYLVTIQIKRVSLGKAEESGRLLGRMIALSMGEDIVRGNFQGIEYALKEFTKMDRIEYCLILDNYGRIIASTHPDSHGKYFADGWSRSALFSSDIAIRRAANKNRPVYDMSLPIVIGGKKYAIVRTGFTIDEEYTHIRDLLFYNLSLGIVLILIGIFIAYGISATMLNPLNSILGSIESISRGDYTYEATVNTSDEFEELAVSFNRLASILHNRETTSSLITKKILENDSSLANKNFSGKTVDSVVLHLELNRFNSFIERNSPSEAVDTLNAFFSGTAEIIAQAGGIIDRFGDGFITALFPIASSGNWPAHLRAGFAALLARNNINIFNYKQAQLGLEAISMKAGLTSGQVIIGHIGTRSRSDFSTIGSRLAQVRKTAELSDKNIDFMPVSDRDFAASARDFLLLAPLHDKSGDNENDYFVLKGFSNLSYFRELLKDTSAHGNSSIITAFGLNEKSEGFEFLKTAIADETCKYRQQAIISLSSFMFRQNSEVKEYLREFIEQTPDLILKASAISILGMSQDDKLADFYSSLFNNSEDRVRANAVEAYISLNVPNKREQLKNLLKDPAPRVCANALLGLWLADDQTTLSCLYERLKSDSSEMRASAAFAVYFLANARKFSRLFPAHNENSSFTALPIVENIYKRLTLMLESQESSERLQALRAIGKTGDPESKNLIKEMLTTETEPEIINLGRSIIAEWEKN